MNETLAQFQAPWGTTLKVISLVSTVLMVAIASLGILGLALHRGNLIWGLAMIALPLLLLLFGALTTVRGYALTPEQLIVKRLGWKTPIALHNLKSVEADPEVVKGSIRLWGNGGLYSFTGTFRNRSLGNYRAYITDFKRCVVLRFPDRAVVVSPDHPDDFVNQVRMLIRR